MIPQESKSFCVRVVISNIIEFRIGADEFLWGLIVYELIVIWQHFGNKKSDSQNKMWK